MSHSTRWGFVTAVIAAGLVAACATGGAPAGEPSDAAVVHHDANNVTASDASKHDGGGGHDAVSTPDASPDAGGGSGGQFCSTNANCPDSGTCCWVAICVPGQGIGSNLCIPN
jgi:hypothetical protein